MAPIKFEEDLREKLEKRSLEPSANAWQSLAQALDADSKKTNKNKFLWFGIAAGLIGFLFVVSQFVSLDKTNPVNAPIVVESENKTITNPIKTPLVIEESQQVVQKLVEEIPVNQKLNTVSTNKTTAKNKKEKQPLLRDVAIIAKQKKKAKELKVLIISQDEVVASAVNTEGFSENKENIITAIDSEDSEIETLLNTANKSIALKGNNAKNTMVVDANALLEDVETEMPPSLRGQLLKVIAENFITATTAVSTRNE